MQFHGIIGAIRRRPIVIWLLLLYLSYQFSGLIGSVISWHQDIFSGAPINEPIGYAIYSTTAVLFMALLVGSAIAALWNGRKSGLILSCVIVCLYFYRSLLIDVLGEPVTMYLDETGEESTAFFHVYGHRLHQLLQVTLASAPIWSKATRKYVGWNT